MHGTGDEERRIKNLLGSGREDDLGLGFELLVAVYQGEICGYLRNWAAKRHVPISPFELGLLWQHTLVSVFEKVRSGGFTYDGSLPAMLRKIAHARAVDMVRKRVHAINPGDRVLENIADRDGKSGIDEDVLACCREMPESLRIVLLIDVQLFYQLHKWPSLCELTDEVNNSCDPPLSEAAVKSRRDRARAMLRSRLRERERRHDA